MFIDVIFLRNTYLFENSIGLVVVTQEHSVRGAYLDQNPQIVLVGSDSTTNVSQNVLKRNIPSNNLMSCARRK